MLIVAIKVIATLANAIVIIRANIEDMQSGWSMKPRWGVYLFHTVCVVNLFAIWL